MAWTERRDSDEFFSFLISFPGSNDLIMRVHLLFTLDCFLTVVGVLASSSEFGDVESLMSTNIDEFDVQLFRDRDTEFFLSRLADIGLVDSSQIYPDGDNIGEFDIQSQIFFMLLVLGTLIIISIGLGVKWLG